jgi:pseudouridine-5'-phosphate glycosidase
VSADPLLVSPPVAAALAAGAPVVALESTLLAHGLPARRGLEVGRALEAEVRAAGAVPATIAVLGGRVRVGLAEGELAALLGREGVPKLGVRDLPVAVARGGDGATTVASTAALAARAGVRVFATGGLGGVHREWARTLDESADLSVLGATRITVVSAGVKSILDVPATLERLETLGVAVLGYRTDRFPGFYVSDGGAPLDWRVESPAEVAAVMAAQDALDLPRGAILVANPLAPDRQLDPEAHAAALEGALAAAAAQGLAGKPLTPFLLDHVQRATGGRSVEVNVELVLANARLAAQIAVAHAA